MRILTPLSMAFSASVIMFINIIFINIIFINIMFINIMFINIIFIDMIFTARSLEDETRNCERNTNPSPVW